MARPIKEGLDYFPLDTDIDQDDKVVIIIAKYGMEGFGVLIKLLMEIYKNGYFYNWTEKEQIIFSSRVNVNINTVKDIVNDCIKWGLFNEKKYEEHNVLTSKGIQERYLLATSRRVSVDINEDLKLVSVDINSKSVEKPPTKSTQKKRKETKLKDIKQNNNINAFDFYQQNFGVLKPFVVDDIGHYVDDVGEELVIEAMKIALLAQKTWNYAAGILKDWHSRNLKTLEDVQAYNKDYERQKQTRTGKGVKVGTNEDAAQFARENGIPF